MVLMVLHPVGGLGAGNTPHGSMGWGEGSNRTSTSSRTFYAVVAA